MAADHIDPMRPGEATLCRRVVETLGSKWPYPLLGGADDLRALQWMLDEQGSQHFTALELTAVPPDKTALARRLGFEALVPPRQWWPRVAALVAVLERMRRDAGAQPVRVRWVWRPQALNRAVRGAPRSDHLEARAADCYLMDEAHRVACLAALQALEERHPEAHLAVGTGRTMLHVGVLRPGGPARWSY